MTELDLDPTTTQKAGELAEPDPKRWIALGVIAVAQLMVVLDASIINIALPKAQAALHISTVNRQWVITAYTLAFGGLLLLGGRIADYVASPSPRPGNGRRRSASTARSPVEAQPSV